MRSAAALLAAAFLAAGCMLTGDDELEAHVKNIAPEHAQMLECAWQNNLGDAETKAASTCIGTTRNAVSGRMGMNRQRYHGVRQMNP